MHVAPTDRLEEAANEPAGHLQEGRETHLVNVLLAQGQEGIVVDLARPASVVPAPFERSDCCRDTGEIAGYASVDPEPGRSHHGYRRYGKEFNTVNGARSRSPAPDLRRMELV